MEVLWAVMADGLNQYWFGAGRARVTESAVPALWRLLIAALCLGAFLALLTLAGISR